jgi:DNA ligase-1
MPTEVPGLLSHWLEGLDATERWALLKLVTGALRVGVSARLAKTALAAWSGQPLTEIEEVWHGLKPPYIALFAWLSGKASKPDVGTLPTFRPLMLSHQIEDKELAALDAKEFVAEWKWDGIRVLIKRANGDCSRAPATTSLTPSRTWLKACRPVSCSTASSWSCGTARSRRSKICNNGSTANR